MIRDTYIYTLPIIYDDYDAYDVEIYVFKYNY